MMMEGDMRCERLFLYSGCRPVSNVSSLVVVRAHGRDMWPQLARVAWCALCCMLMQECSADLTKHVEA